MSGSRLRFRSLRTVSNRALQTLPWHACDHTHACSVYTACASTMAMSPSLCTTTESYMFSKTCCCDLRYPSYWESFWWGARVALYSAEQRPHRVNWVSLQLTFFASLR
eukprot:6138475-Amphidinium_carterae.2